MKKFLLIFLLAALCGVSSSLRAQQMSEPEQEDLRQAVGEAGDSPVEIVAILEAHLKKYPNSPRKDDLERAIVKAAYQAKDDRRLILYGEKVLAKDPEDLQLLERVTRALLRFTDKDHLASALQYARQYENALKKTAQSEKPESPRELARFHGELDHEIGRAEVFEARATGNLGQMEQAASLAKEGYETYPTAEAAREVAGWEERLGQKEEAIRYYAEAFTIADSAATDAERASDRQHMGAIYRKEHSSEKGLGDLILEAYDRTQALVAARKLRARQYDPNAQITNPMEFTLSGLNGGKLNMASLRGKVVVLDFWATWCGPCRAQHPLYEEVKQRFKNRNDVMFVAINTDEDRAVVAPFLEAQKWSTNVYFDDGLGDVLKVTSIPTTMILDKKGAVVSRLNGYVPERFVDMLADRIQRALNE